jgi:hypothetical protein
MNDLLSKEINRITNFVHQTKNDIIRKLIGEDCFRHPHNLLSMDGLNEIETYLIPLDTRMLYIELHNNIIYKQVGDRYMQDTSISYEWTYI